MTGSTSRVMNARTLLSSSRSCVLEEQLEAEEVGEGGVLEPEVLEVSHAVLLVAGRLDHGGQLVGLGQDAEVSAAVDVQPRAAGSAGPASAGCTTGMIGSSSPPITSVGCRIRPQERQAAPAGHRGQLVVVAALGPRPGGGVQQVGADHGVGAHAAAVDLGGDARGVRRVAVASRRDIFAQHPRVRRAPSATPVPVATSTTRRTRRAGLDGELLGQPAAPGEPEHVELAVTEPGHQRGRPRRTAPRSGREAAAAALPPTPGTSNRTTPRSGSSGVDQRLQRLEADPDAVAQQQRRLVDAAGRAPGAPRPVPGCRAPSRADPVGRRRSRYYVGISGHGRRCPERRRSARASRSPAGVGLLRSGPVRSASHST